MEDMDEIVFILRQSWQFSFIVLMNRVLFLIWTLTWFVNNFVSSPRKGKDRGNECTISPLESQLTVKIMSRGLLTSHIFRCSPKLNKKHRTVQSSLVFNFSSLKKWQYWEASKSWQLFQGEHKKILGTASHRTGSFLELLQNNLRRFLRRLKAGSLKNCPRNTTGQSVASQVLYRNKMTFFWTHSYGHSPEPFREHPGTMTWKTDNRIGIVPRMTPIPNWSSLPGRPALQLTQTRRRPLTIKMVVKWNIRTYQCLHWKK